MADDWWPKLRLRLLHIVGQVRITSVRFLYSQIHPSMMIDVYTDIKASTTTSIFISSCALILSVGISVGTKLLLLQLRWRFSNIIIMRTNLKERVNAHGCGHTELLAPDPCHILSHQAAP
uniref:Uncharacterized protein n=1 Tax=Kalanchoe fedtschenkoi TaxID=63787 RepID=A0A7N0TWB3_KALFE